MTRQPERVTSRDNSLVKLLRRLATHSSAYRKLGQFWVEGEHLCGAALDRGVSPSVAVLAESFWTGGNAHWTRTAQHKVVVPDRLFDQITGMESAGGIGFLIDLPGPQELRASMPSVILDRVQDAGNVGSILRSAAAFGFTQVLSLKGSAALWAPKVLRAGMGAHFGLHLVEGLDQSQLVALDVPLVATSSHHGVALHEQELAWPSAWAFGNEGQGLDPGLLSRADRLVRIGQPGGEESLNVAAAAAICLYASSVARRRAPTGYGSALAPPL